MMKSSISHFCFLLSYAIVSTLYTHQSYPPTVAAVKFTVIFSKFYMDINAVLQSLQNSNWEMERVLWDAGRGKELPRNEYCCVKTKGSRGSGKEIYLNQSLGG